MMRLVFKLSSFRYDNIRFNHTHLSGTGAEEYGDILLMSISNKKFFDEGNKSETKFSYKSKFKHFNEKAYPKYYLVMLDD